MGAKILMLIFFLGGLIAIAVVAAIFSKYFVVHTTADSGTARGVILWGCVMATLWLFYGGLFVFYYLIGE